MFGDDDYSAEPTPNADTPAYPPRPTSQADADAGEPEARITDHETPLADREVPRHAVADTPAPESTGDRAALFEGGDLDGFNARWSEIQASFVDEPRRAVEQADALVSDVITRIGDSFGTQRNQLEAQWDGGGDVSTEDLRQTLQRYRSFFSRLLGV
jgi:hypothetical protein